MKTWIYTNVFFQKILIGRVAFIKNEKYICAAFIDIVLI